MKGDTVAGVEVSDRVVIWSATAAGEMRRALLCRLRSAHHSRDGDHYTHTHSTHKKETIIIRRRRDDPNFWITHVRHKYCVHI